MKTFLKEHWFRLGILIVLLIIAGSVCYYFAIYIPQRDENDRVQESLKESIQKQEAQDQKNKQAEALQICLISAQDDYDTNWGADCKLEGKASTCTSLLIVHANLVNDTLQSEKSDCFKEYPQN